MKSTYNLKSLDSNTVNSIRADWIEQVEKGDDSTLELTDSYFDYLMSGNNFGDLLARSNQNTYMSIYDVSNGLVVGIAEIIYARQGAKSICKIMDISHAPCITNLDDQAYLAKSFDILISILMYMLKINNSTKHGITKVYARDDAAQVTIREINDNVAPDAFKEIGFKMKLSGHRWLEFEKI